MYKMKDVCQMTGLTEKAIRLYMEQKLVEPKVEEGVHRNAYYFEEKDIERLKDVAALRNAGFSMADIKLMLDNPANISAIVEEKEALLAMEINQKISIQEALSHLSIQEHSDVAKLADAIEPRSTYAKETPKSKMSRGMKWLILLAIISVWLIFNVINAGVLILGAYAVGFGFTFGLFATVSSIRYFLYGRRVRKMKKRGTGKVSAIVANDKIEEYISEENSTLKDIGLYLTYGIAGGIWEKLRPDCWYPVIHYQSEDGTTHTATIRHGSFKNGWKIGEKLEISWEDGKEKLVYVCNNRELRKKAWAHFIPGVIMLIISLSLFYGQLVRIGVFEGRDHEVVEMSPRELTTEEIAVLTDIASMLAPIEKLNKSFVSSELLNQEVLGLSYKICMLNTDYGESSAFQASILQDIALECFGYDLKLEDQILCDECDEAIAEYDKYSMMLEINQNHKHRHKMETNNTVYVYHDSIFNGKQYVVEIYKISQELPEEKILCSYSFESDKEENVVIGMKDIEYFLVSYAFNRQ